MNLKEIQKMGNKELLIRFQGLCHISGAKDVTCEKKDDDLYMDIHLLEEEIMLRMSSGGSIDYTNKFN